MKLSNAIAQRVKSRREAAGLSQQDVAVRADLSMSLVAKMEQGKKADPRASTLLALAGALNVKPGAMLEDLFPPMDSKLQAEDHPATEESAAEEPAAKTEPRKKKKKGKPKQKSK